MKTITTRDNHQTVKVSDIAYHRNGVSGEGFYVAKFTTTELPGHKMVGVIFSSCVHKDTASADNEWCPDGAGRCAVFDIDQLGAGDIAFGSNSWRGDHYESALIRVIGEWNAAQ